MIGLHVGDKRLCIVHLGRSVAAAMATALAVVILVDVETPQHLLAAGVEVGFQVLVGLGVDVRGFLLLVGHARIELALDALQVTLLHRSTWSGTVGGNGGLALCANLLSHQQGEYHKHEPSRCRDLLWQWLLGPLELS